MWKMNSPAQRQGQYYEKIACRFLVRAGLQLEQKNFRTRAGELDLIFRDGNTLVFVEVRFRKSDHYGGAFSSVTRHKQQKIIRAAQSYLLGNRLYEKLPCRFDVIGITPTATGLDVKWIKNAFS